MEILLIVVGIVVSILCTMIGFVVNRILNIQKLTEDLHEWHNHRDPDGVFSWYIRQSLEDKISDLAAAIGDLVVVTKEQSHMLMSINHNVRRNNDDIDSVAERVSRVEEKI